MALDAIELAHKLHDALSKTSDKDGLPTSVSGQSLNYSKGIIAALKAAIVSNPPGTINGSTPPGSSLVGGTGFAGIIAITPAPMLAETLPAFATSPDIAKENIAIVQYIGTALVTFSAGNITGTCTNTGDSPGPLISGAGSGGKLTLITGVGAYAAVSAVLGVLGPSAIIHYTALIDYIKEKAEASYSSGSVIGVCPSGGGVLIAGTASGGTIS